MTKHLYFKLQNENLEKLIQEGIDSGIAKKFDSKKPYKN
jgi:hypothetical protein